MITRKLFGARAVVPQTMHPRFWTPAVTLAPVHGASAHSNLLSRENLAGETTHLLESTLSGYREDQHGILWFLRCFTCFPNGTTTTEMVGWRNCEFFLHLARADTPHDPGETSYYRREYLIPVQHPLYLHLVSAEQHHAWRSNTTP